MTAFNPESVADDVCSGVYGMDRSDYHLFKADVTQALREAFQAGRAQGEEERVRQRVSEIVGIVVRNKMVDRDLLLEVLTAPVFRSSAALTPPDLSNFIGEPIKSPPDSGEEKK